MLATFGVVAYAWGYRPVSDAGEVSIQFIKTGALNIDADGENNKVYINDDYIGLAPQKVDGLRKGKYAIRIEKDDFVPYNTVVEVIEDNVIHITPTLISREFSATKIFETTNNTNFHSFQKSPNKLFSLSNSGNKLTFNILNLNDIKNTFRYFFPADLSSTFSLNNVYLSDLSKIQFGLNTSNNFSYIYDETSKNLYSIDLSAKVLNNSIDLSSLFNSPKFKVLNDILYIYDDQKVYKYNFYSKSLALKFNLPNTDKKFSFSNNLFVFDSSKIQIISTTDSLNDSKILDIDLLSYNFNSASTAVFNIGETGKFLVQDSSKLLILSQSGAEIDTMPANIKKVKDDGLSIITDEGILRFNHTSNKYILETYKDESLKWSNIEVVKIANKSFSILCKDNSGNYYISDYNLQKLVKLPLPSMIDTDNYEVIMDSEDEIYLTVTSASGKFTVYKY